MAMSFGASDLHLRAGSFPVIRVNGELRPMSGVSRLTQDETLEMAFSMMSNRQKMHFKDAFEVDIGYGVSGLGRFRVNIFQQRNSIGIVDSRVPARTHIKNRRCRMPNDTRKRTVRVWRTIRHFRNPIRDK
jgi:twitching motility protein PilT